MQSKLRSPKELEKADRILGELPDSLDGLADKLMDTDADVRRLAAMRLGQSENQKSIEPLLSALEDDSADVRASVALALGFLNAEAAVIAIAGHLKSDQSARVRAMCTWALSLIGGGCALDCLALALDDPDEHVRLSACSAFAHAGDTRAQDEIVRMLEDPVWDVRKAACEVLIALGIADQRIVATIDALKKQPEAEEYERGIVEMHAHLNSDEYKQLWADIDSEEDQAEETAGNRWNPDELMLPTLDELAEKARELLTSSEHLQLRTK